MREALRSAAWLVAVEAPAGCGKTHEAAEAAADLAEGLPMGRELLLLAHTNAAVSEFRRRLRQRRARVRASTLDAFALELITHYAAPLGLPWPIIPGDGPGQVPFRGLAPKAAELLRRAPSLAKALGLHYPVVFIDEHQDTRVEQFDFVRAIVEAGEGRLRTFGDPMQAIYGMDPLIDWADHCQHADRVEVLEEPHRWAELPELGAWVCEAREELKRGGTLPLASRPECVNVRMVPGTHDSQNPNSTRVQPELIRPLRWIASVLEGSLVILTRYNAHARGLNSALRGTVVIQEGADFEPAYRALNEAEAVVGQPREMALALVDLLRATCTGLNRRLTDQITRSLHADRIDRGRRERIRPLLQFLTPLYTSPDLATWCEAIRRVLASPPAWLKIDLRMNLRVLAGLRPGPDDSGRELLDRATRRYREGAPPPLRCVSTIHKAKGQEYDHVIIVAVGASAFPDSVEGRQLLYTAISRARKSVTLVIPEQGPSPLSETCDGHAAAT